MENVTVPSASGTLPRPSSNPSLVSLSGASGSNTGTLRNSVYQAPATTSIPDLKLTSRMQMVSHQDKEVVSASKEHSRTDASLERKAQTCVENTAERHISSGDADNASLDKGDDSGKDGDDKEEVESNDGSPPVADPAGKW